MKYTASTSAQETETGPTYGIYGCTLSQSGNSNKPARSVKLVLPAKDTFHYSCSLYLVPLSFGLRTNLQGTFRAGAPASTTGFVQVVGLKRCDRVFGDRRSGHYTFVSAHVKSQEVSGTTVEV